VGEPRGYLPHYIDLRARSPMKGPLILSRLALSQSHLFRFMPKFCF